MKSIGIFCGSSAGEHPLYLETARLVGRTLAQQGLALVYGGGKVGLMGAVADSALEAGGVVIGVMPRGLGGAGNCPPRLDGAACGRGYARAENQNGGAGGWLYCPAGRGGDARGDFRTMDWAQLGIHEKPCAFLNIKGYYDPLQAMVDNMVREGFMHPRYAEMLPFATSADEIIAGFRDYTPPARKWVQQTAI